MRQTVIRATSVRTPFVVGGVMVGDGSSWVFTCGPDTSMCGNSFLSVKKKNIQTTNLKDKGVLQNGNWSQVRLHVVFRF